MLRVGHQSQWGLGVWPDINVRCVKVSVDSAVNNASEDKAAKMDQ